MGKVGFFFLLGPWVVRGSTRSRPMMEIRWENWGHSGPCLGRECCRPSHPGGVWHMPGGSVLDVLGLRLPSSLLPGGVVAHSLAAPSVFSGPSPGCGGGKLAAWGGPFGALLVKRVGIGSLLGGVAPWSCGQSLAPPTGGGSCLLSCLHGGGSSHLLGLGPRGWCSPLLLPVVGGVRLSLCSFMPQKGKKGKTGWTPFFPDRWGGDGVGWLPPLGSPPVAQP